MTNNSLTGADVRALATGDVTNGGLLAEDFAPGQLPSGAQGPKGDKGDQGLRRASRAMQGAAGRHQCRGAVVRLRIAVSADRPTETPGGIGSAATCAGPRLPRARRCGGRRERGGPGGVAGAGNCDGTGLHVARWPAAAGQSRLEPAASATCSGDGLLSAGRSRRMPGRPARPSPARARSSGSAPSACPGSAPSVAASRATAGAPSSSRTHPVALERSTRASSEPPADGQPANAWYVEAYNQSKAGENRRRRVVPYGRTSSAPPRKGI